MDSGDDIAEGSISSLLIDSLKSNKSGDVLSPEEIAWVDSCLVKDPEISDSDWSSMKDALIEILGLGPESCKATAMESDDFPGGTDIEMLPPNERGIAKSSDRSDDDSVRSNSEMDERIVDFSTKEETGISLSEDLQGDVSGSSLRNAFLPNYREDNENASESADSGLNGGSSANELEPSKLDIFKVWDLGIPSEEDELEKQLNKALSESSVESVPPPLADNSRGWKDSKLESVDDLIAGISGLSLNQHSK